MKVQSPKLSPHSRAPQTPKQQQIARVTESLKRAADLADAYSKSPSISEKNCEIHDKIQLPVYTSTDLYLRDELLQSKVFLEQLAESIFDTLVIVDKGISNSMEMLETNEND